jgi:hypothetical protein
MTVALQSAAAAAGIAGLVVLVLYLARAWK